MKTKHNFDKDEEIQISSLKSRLTHLSMKRKNEFDKDEKMIINSAKSKLSHARNLFKPTKMKDIIESRNGLNVLIKHKGINEDSRIFCDKIEYMHDRKGKIFDHHLMFWLKDELVFKIWLPNESKDKQFKDINEALKNCGIRVIK